jgi:hypothetical protein
MFSERDEVVAVLARLDAAVEDLTELSFDGLTTPERLRVSERLETVTRRLPVAGHALINQLIRQATPAEVGGKLAHVLADRLRISRAEANRRIGEAEDLGERRALTGEALPARLPATAEAQRDGAIGTEAVRVIRGFCHRLPDFVDVETREKAEAHLAALGGEHRPDELAKLADRLAYCLNQDGNFSDADRARRRGLVVGKQDIDGMSVIKGYLTPAARAALEAVLAKLAAPGMANPDDEQPVVEGTPSQEAINGDTRTAAQRNHDGLHAAARALLASGELGQHNGLPASIIVSTTLQELESGCGKGLTGGGSLLPMSDVVRMASAAHHYLAIFDKGRALALYHTKRLASPAQRVVLHAKDRGCSFPVCDVSAYYCEVHHCTPYAKCRTTDVNKLTLGCGGHHPLAEQGWTTRKNSCGQTEWIPPAHLDRGQARVNFFHHPEKLLRDGDDDEEAE